MSIEYVNRRGDKYYLLQGKTKTGKPKYYVSRKPDGTHVDQMPDGYEFHENPQDGVLSVRKIRPTKVLPQEREQLDAWTRELAGTEFFLVDVQNDSLVVYAPGDDPFARANLMHAIFGGAIADKMSNLSWIGANAAYLPMFRFNLVDEDERLYSADRWCVRGAIDGWIPLSHGKTLEKQAKAYLPHLHKESFYDLM
jgi:choline dehydrogenase-like flavoprotein